MIPFYETLRYKNACLSNLDFPQEIIQKLCNWVKSNKGILFFSGNPGCGKSYFSAAYINHLKETKKNFRGLSEYQFFSLLRESIQKGFEYEYEIQKLAESDYLIIDDIVTARSSELSAFQKEALHLLIDMRYNFKLPTLLTSNIFLEDIKVLLGDKIHSRLAAYENTVIEINWIDKRSIPGSWMEKKK